MNYAVQHITLDIEKAGSQACVICRKGDTARRIAVHLVQGGKPYPLTAGEHWAWCGGKNAAGTAFLNACTIENGIAFYNLTTGNTGAAGKFSAAIYIADKELEAERILHLEAPMFTVIVAGSMIDTSAAQETEEWTALDEILATGLAEVTAEVDQTTGTASVTVTSTPAEGGGKKLHFAFSGLKGGGGGTGGSSVTMADNASGGVDLTVDGATKTLAKESELADKVDKTDYNPVDKSAAMTQAVGKDANGRLWTSPGSGGGGTGGAVTSVNGQTGDVILTADDVGALPDSTSIPTKTSDLTNDSKFLTEPTTVKTTLADDDSIFGIGFKIAWENIKTALKTYFDTLYTKVVEATVAGWGFTKNTGTITGITMNGASKGSSGVVDLGTVVTDISGKVDKTDYNPADKTDSMTQAVGKDTDGKLWTAPGSGGGGDDRIYVGPEAPDDPKYDIWLDTDEPALKIWLPAVSEAGMLSWEKSASDAAPEAVSIKGEKGDKGDTGASPVRGVDYWTAADKQEIVDSARTALYSPNEYKAESFELSSADIGRTIVSSGTGSLTVILTQTASAAMPMGAEIALFRFLGSEFKIQGSGGVRFVMPYKNVQTNGTLSLPELYTLAALKKMTTDAANGDIWTVQGDVEAVT